MYPGPRCAVFGSRPESWHVMQLARWQRLDPERWREVMRARLAVIRER